MNINIEKYILSKKQKAIKRTFDLIFGGIVLLLIIFPCLLIAVAIKLTSSGPILVKSTRVGVDGKEFSMLKFRTMSLNAENEKIIRQTTKNDSRITPIGAFLRRTSLDEMPQFLSVMKGDMSIVGPHPQVPFYHEKFGEKYIRFEDIKSGITGWAQINNWRGDIDTMSTLENNLLYDEYYIDNWSLWFDIKIVLLTILNSDRGNAY